MSTTEFLSYLAKGPSPYHCVQETARILREAGFQEVDERAEPHAVAPGATGFVRRAGTIIAWRAGHAHPVSTGFRLLGAHTDSPNLRIKPRPDVKSEGYWQWGVEVYGGALLATWTDRDLGLAGRVFVQGEDGKPNARLFQADRPLARIPNLAIHLNRHVNDEGLKLDAQKHLAPMISSWNESRGFRKWLTSEVGAEVLTWDLSLYDLAAPVVGGLDGEFVFSARLDNQAGCYAALRALLDADVGEATQVMVLFDHEEVGSRSAQGAMGAFLRDVLQHLVLEHTEHARGGLERAMANSFFVSIDMAHGVHPNYASVHEPNHRPVLNEGPVIKEHTEQRYATDAESSAIFRLACAKASVPVQDFVIRTDLGCGSTIGPIAAAQLGVRTVDVGAPMLSMHSIREQCGVHDTELLIRALRTVLNA